MGSKEKRIKAERESSNQEVKHPLLDGPADNKVTPHRPENGDRADVVVGDVQWWGDDGREKDSCSMHVSVDKMVAGETMAMKPERAVRHPTSYIETLIHVLKGNIGSGMFAMGEAFKHAGLLLGSVLTLILGIICIYNNHVLINCAEFVQEKKKMQTGTSFSCTVELSFLNGPVCFRKWTKAIRRLVKGFVIVTQLGFCTVYVVLVSSTLSKVLKHYDIEINDRWYMLMIFLPILASCLITSLKFLAPVSLGSNMCVMGAVFLTLYVACKDGLPEPTSRPMVGDLASLPLFVGTVIYAFEGIGLILPLQNEMKKPRMFGSKFGVLNVGLTIVMVMLVMTGFIGFLKYGDAVKGSLSLNIPPADTLGILVQTIFAVGIGFSYPLQFYVAADIIWEDIDEKWGPYKKKLVGKLLTRTFLVICTFLVSAIIPNVGLFISLIGAVCSTALALVFPALADIALRTSRDDPMKTKCHKFRIFLDVLTLIVAVLGFTTGTYCSVKDIIHAFVHPTSEVK